MKNQEILDEIVKMKKARLRADEEGNVKLADELTAKIKELKSHPQLKELYSYIDSRIAYEKGVKI